MPSIKIKGMNCQHCVASVTDALQKIAGISEVKVVLEKGEATFQTDKPVADEVIRQAIKEIGFTCE
ncbi:MAG: heavy-metal-associated domain-containing protein [Desulfobulbaceae bacterium]|nr:heavy-metal-associated domain-containing protein [Desulfobulbaceae bacterium]HIJ78032.1 heavy-metal-associated domain-containing protein [Deltaproteobacteria bacterium]